MPLAIHAFVHGPVLLGNVRVGELHGDHPMQVVAGRLVVANTQTAMPWQVHKIPVNQVYKTPVKVTLSDFFWVSINPGHWCSFIKNVF